MNNSITIETTVNAPLEQVWDLWNAPSHIEEWMHASDEWECSWAENELKVGGGFVYTLGAKDSSNSFNLAGTYTAVEPLKLLAYTLEDGRFVSVSFEQAGDSVHIVQTFEMEKENSEELQRTGWQATLNNFKKHVESFGQLP